jgi:hypothetical protein
MTSGTQKPTARSDKAVWCYHCAAGADGGRTCTAASQRSQPVLLW